MQKPGRVDLGEPARPRHATYKWAVVGMLWFICFFNYADRQALFAVFPLLKARYHFNQEQLGLIGAAFTWVYALSAPFAASVRFWAKVKCVSKLPPGRSLVS